MSIESFRLPNLLPGEGLVEVECCTLCGSDLHTIAGLDVDSQRAERALQFGATQTSVTALPKLTEQRGADMALDFSGSAAAMEQALGHLRIGGKLVLVGAVYADRPLSLSAELLVRRMIQIEGGPQLHSPGPDDSDGVSGRSPAVFSF